MKKTVWVLILAMVICTLTGCNLFYDPKLVSYSVRSTTPGVSVDIVAADEDGAIFTRSTQTDWSSPQFSVKYSNFPFLAHIVVTNNGGSSVNMAVYLEGTVVTSKTVAGGETDVITTSVYY